MGPTCHISQNQTLYILPGTLGRPILQVEEHITSGIGFEDVIQTQRQDEGFKLDLFLFNLGERVTGFFDSGRRPRLIQIGCIVGLPRAVAWTKSKVDAWVRRVGRLAACQAYGTTSALSGSMLTWDHIDDQRWLSTGLERVRVDDEDG